LPQPTKITVAPDKRSRHYARRSSYHTHHNWQALQADQAPPLVYLKVVYGPRDQGEPVVTVMMPDKD